MIEIVLRVITSFIATISASIVCGILAPVFLKREKANEEDEKITIKKLFRKPTVYYYSDIISFTRTGNLKVVTTKGKFMLFNMLAGTNSLRQLIATKKSRV